MNRLKYPDECTHFRMPIIVEHLSWGERLLNFIEPGFKLT